LGQGRADVPTRTTQYFEMLGNRAIYHDGWVACDDPGDAAVGTEFEARTGRDHRLYKWELYNVAEDPTQSNDLAASDAGQAQGDAGSLLRRGGEAQRAAAGQLDADALERAEAEPHRGRTEFTYSGPLTGVPTSGAPSILNKSYTITAEVTIPKGGAEGMIVTEGGRFGGYGLFLSKGVAGIRRASRCSCTTCSTSSARSGTDPS
jgi:hypothetical protein